MRKGGVDKHASIDMLILKIVKEKAPDSVSDLIKLVQTQCSVNEDELVQRVLKLENQGKITFNDQSLSISRSAVHSLFLEKLRWYWIVTALNILGAALIFAIPENAIPAVYFRYIAGSVFFLVLPGYSVTKVLFRNKDLDFAQRITFAIGCNVALVGIVAFALNLTQWGVRTFSVTLSLTGITALLSTIAFVREYVESQKTRPQIR